MCSPATSIILSMWCLRLSFTAFSLYLI
ncbi:MAG: photosystem II reaction center protein PsbN [Clostridiales bacterium]|nr:photosystem II reaction center protein PsbN [Clostridiales bacterium]